MGSNSRAKDERADSREFDEDVNGWTRGILKRISNSVSNNRGSMLSVTLSDEFTFVILGVFASKLSSLDEFLAVVPSTTRVGGREGNLDTRNDSSSKDTISGLEAKEPSNEKWGKNNQTSWSNHFPEGSSG